MPDRADCVDHIPGGKAVTAGYLRFPSFTTAEGSALRQEAGSGSTVNRTVYTATAKQGIVGGVDNGIDMHFGDVVPDNFKWHTDTSHRTFLSRFGKGKGDVLTETTSGRKSL